MLSHPLLPDSNSQSFEPLRHSCPFGLLLVLEGFDRERFCRFLQLTFWYSCLDRSARRVGDIEDRDGRGREQILAPPWTSVDPPDLETHPEASPDGDIPRRNLCIALDLVEGGQFVPV